MYDEVKKENNPPEEETKKDEPKDIAEKYKAASEIIEKPGEEDEPLIKRIVPDDLPLGEEEDTTKDGTVTFFVKELDQVAKETADALR